MNVPKSSPRQCQMSDGFADGVGLDDGSFSPPDRIIVSAAGAEGLEPVATYFEAAAAFRAFTTATVTTPILRAVEFFRTAFGGSAEGGHDLATVEQVVAVSEVEAMRRGDRRMEASAD
jgi:hypothetical protein